MEQVLYRLHVRLMIASNIFLGDRFRKLLENTTLCAAIMSVLLLYLFHETYITNSSIPTMNCLLKYSVKFDEVTPFSADLVKITVVNQLQNASFVSWNDNGNSVDKVFLFSYERGLLLLNRTVALEHNFTRLELVLKDDDACFGSFLNTQMLRHWIGYDVVVINSAVAAFGGNGYLFNDNTKELFNLNFASDFVSKKGVTMLDKSKNVVLESGSTSYWNAILSNVWMGMIDNNSVLNLAADGVYHVASLLSDYSSQWFSLTSCSYGEVTIAGQVCAAADRSWLKAALLTQLYQYTTFRIGVVLSTVFLFVVTTTLVSYTLRETQERMLRFTYLLQFHVTHRLSIVSLVVTHVLESLVFVPIILGIYFFLFEFFSDQLLAFLVILLVWMGEIFSVLSCRCRISIRFFPKIFCCYFSLFHIYFFTFPFGFSYLALWTVALFMLHSMMHFWNTYEVAAFSARTVTAVNPRAGLSNQMASHEESESVITRVPTASPAEQLVQSSSTRVDRQSHVLTVAETTQMLQCSTPRGGSGMDGAAPRAVRQRNNSHDSPLPVVFETLQTRRLRLDRERLASSGGSVSISPARNVGVKDQIALQSRIGERRGRVRSSSDNSRLTPNESFESAGAAAGQNSYGYQSSRYTVFGNMDEDA